MALRAVELGSLQETTIAATTASIHAFAPTPRMITIAAARRERRRWLVLAGFVFLTPLAACLGVLEVVR